MNTNIISYNASTDTTQIVDKYLDKLVTLFESLAQKAGVGVEHFWPLLVKAQIIEGITRLLLWILLCVFVVWSFNNLKKQKDITEFHLLQGIITALLLLPVVIFALEFGAETFYKIFIPEYSALQTLLNLTK